jgi:hypothetical protein
MSQATTVKFSPIANGRPYLELETTLGAPSDEEFTPIENNPDFGVFRILDQKEGDKRLVWNRLSMGDISEANRMFDRFVSEGLDPYRVGGDGKTGARMDKFDPTAEEVIFLPIKMVAGG